MYDYDRSAGIAIHLGQPRKAGADQFARYVQLAADDIKSLRKSDVYRVLEQATNAKELSELVAYIGKGNPSLKSTAVSDAAELSDEKGWSKSAASAQLEKAVELAQLYAGSSLRMNVRDAQKIYNQMMRACEAIARKKNLEVGDVVEQIQAEASKRGPKQARPGQHY